MKTYTISQFSSSKLKNSRACVGQCVGKHTDCKLNDVSKDTTTIDKYGSKYTAYADIVRKNEIYKIHIEPDNE